MAKRGWARDDDWRDRPEPPVIGATPVTDTSRVSGSVVSEWVVERECVVCGRMFRYAGRGRPAIYCEVACRDLASEMRSGREAPRGRRGYPPEGGSRSRGSGVVGRLTIGDLDKDS
jgi:hypothetical protein